MMRILGRLDSDCGSDSDLGRSDSSKSSNFGHEEEDEKEEKDLALDYTQVLGK